MSIIPYKVVHDKVSRVSAILPLIQGGRVFLPENAKWIDDFMDETVTFPNGMYDDQVDAMTITIDVLSRTSMSPEMFEMMTDTSQSLNSLHDSLGSSLRERANKDIPKFSGWGI